MEGPQCVEPRLVPHQVEQGGALASGHHQTREAVDLPAAAHLDGGEAESGEGLAVRREVALQREDSKTPDPTKTAWAPSHIMSAASAGVAMPPAAKLGTSSLPSAATIRTSS